MTRCRCHPAEGCSCYEAERDEADAFADSEMERLFPDTDACGLLDAEFPHWYSRCRDRIADVKFSALLAEAEAHASP